MSWYTCTDGKGGHCPILATHALIAPNGRRIGYMCRVHVAAVIREYRSKINERWRAEYVARDQERGAR